MVKENLNKRFTEVFGQEATDNYFAPGRINLIGEHIDYSGGGCISLCYYTRHLCSTQ